MNIKDVIITKLKIIKDERGSVMHMMRNDSNIFKSFGEIYFSTIFKNSIKAWHLHKEATLNYACIKGRVKLVLFDDRTQSSSKGVYEEIILSPQNYFLITIPPNIANAFIPPAPIFIFLLSSSISCLFLVKSICIDSNFCSIFASFCIVLIYRQDYSYPFGKDFYTQDLSVV